MCPGLENQGGSHLLRALSSASNRFLGFMSGVTSADLLASTIVAER